MANLSDLDIGLGIKGMRDLRRDFDRVPNLADDAVAKSESTFDAMALEAPLSGVRGDFNRVPTFASSAVDEAEADFRGLNAEFPGVEAGAGDATSGAVSTFKGLGGPLAIAAAAAGGLAGAALVSEFMDAVDDDKLEDQLAARLALTPGRAKVFGEMAGDLYADAYGDSLEQVHDAIDAVDSSLGDLTPDTVEDLTKRALDLAGTFESDVDESVNAAGVLLRTGLARDGEHAFDLLTRSMQEVPRLMRDEMLPIVEEYSQDFAALGFDGEGAFGLLVEAAQDGRFELDKTGDALKELTIRSTDLSTASRDAYQTIGLDAETMANKIVQGGDTARGALTQIVDGLLGIQDPATRANTAIALLGTPLEDLSVTEIPQFLERLTSMDDGLGNVEGASTRMGETLNTNVATDIDSFTRKASTAIDNWVEDNVLPRAAEVLDAFEEDGVGGALSKAVDMWEDAQPEVQAWWDGTFVPFWEDTAKPWMGYLGAELGAAMLNGLIEHIANTAPRVMFETMNAITSRLPGPLGDWFQGRQPDWTNIPMPDLPQPVAPPSSGGGGGGGGSASSRVGGGLRAFADGGIAKRTAGGIPSRIAEGRYDEAVLPLSAATFSQLGSAVGRYVGGAREAVFVLDGREVARGLIDPLAEEAQRVSLHTAGASPW